VLVDEHPHLGESLCEESDRIIAAGVIHHDDFHRGTMAGRSLQKRRQVPFQELTTVIGGDDNRN